MSSSKLTIDCVDKRFNRLTPSQKKNAKSSALSEIRFLFYHKQCSTTDYEGTIMWLFCSFTKCMLLLE